MKRKFLFFGWMAMLLTACNQPQEQASQPKPEPSTAAPTATTQPVSIPEAYQDVFAQVSTILQIQNTPQTEKILWTSVRVGDNDYKDVHVLANVLTHPTVATDELDATEKTLTKTLRQLGWAKDDAFLTKSQEGSRSGFIKNGHFCFILTNPSKENVSTATSDVATQNPNTTQTPNAPEKAHYSLRLACGEIPKTNSTP